MFDVKKIFLKPTETPTTLNPVRPPAVIQPGSINKVPSFVGKALDLELKVPSEPALTPQSAPMSLTDAIAANNRQEVRDTKMAEQIVVAKTSIEIPMATVEQAAPLEIPAIAPVLAQKVEVTPAPTKTPETFDTETYKKEAYIYFAYFCKDVEDLYKLQDELKKLDSPKGPAAETVKSEELKSEQELLLQIPNILEKINNGNLEEEEVESLTSIFDNVVKVRESLEARITQLEKTANESKTADTAKINSLRDRVKKTELKITSARIENAKEILKVFELMYKKYLEDKAQIVKSAQLSADLSEMSSNIKSGSPTDVHVMVVGGILNAMTTLLGKK